MSRYYRYMAVDETQVSADALEVTDAALSTVLEAVSYTHLTMPTKA